MKGRLAWGAAVLAVACLLAAMPWTRIEPENPLGPTTPISLALPGHGGGQTEEEETQPPETEPPETEPPETEAPETEPPETAPPETQADTTPPPQNVDGPTETAPTTGPTLPVDTPGESGPAEGPGSGENPQPGPTDPDPPLDSDPQIVTDLSNRAVSAGELENDTLPFYAYIQGGGSQLYLRVNLRNANTGDNGTYLAGNGRDYTAALALGQNTFSLYIKDGSRTVSMAVFTITYSAELADEDTPAVGKHPPTIETNLDGWTEEITDPNFTLRVTARTGNGDPIYASGVEVWLDGQPVRNPTGSAILEYALYFPTPVDATAEHKVTVRARDGAGNSRLVSYTVTYRFLDEGQSMGTVRVIVDATTLGLGWIGSSPYTVEIYRGDTIASAVVRALEEDFAEVVSQGSTELGGDFYLRRLVMGDVAKGAKVPENLWQKVLDDGLNLTGQSDRDSIGEFDYTSGSGWMFSRGGKAYATTGMSNQAPVNGETIYLRFTLAYGKDIGAEVSASGNLSTYCGLWINGEYLENHSYDGGEVIQEPTCTQAGVFAYTCQVTGCGSQKTQPWGDALGHQAVETGRQEPTATQDGYVEYACTREGCGETWRQTLPATGGGEPAEPTEPAPTELVPTEPTPTEPEPTDPEPTHPDPAENLSACGAVCPAVLLAVPGSGKNERDEACHECTDGKHPKRSQPSDPGQSPGGTEGAAGHSGPGARPAGGCAGGGQDYPGQCLCQGAGAGQPAHSVHLRYHARRYCGLFGVCGG